LGLEFSLTTNTTLRCVIGWPPLLRLATIPLSEPLAPLPGPDSDSTVGALLTVIDRLALDSRPVVSPANAAPSE